MVVAFTALACSALCIKCRLLYSECRLSLIDKFFAEFTLRSFLCGPLMSVLLSISLVRACNSGEQKAIEISNLVSFSP